jgi:hypothetical protein
MPILTGGSIYLRVGRRPRPLHGERPGLRALNELHRWLSSPHSRAVRCLEFARLDRNLVPDDSAFTLNDQFSSRGGFFPGRMRALGI